uniref:Histone deacetylase complex subunit SAP130 C-terminal domain-containing protein n=1 Tax=Ciona savignyi TaxID=51511 RepID=H2Z619_CIOSA
MACCNTSCIPQLGTGLNRLKPVACPPLILLQAVALQGRPATQVIQTTSFYTPTNFGKTLINNSEGASCPNTPNLTPVERKSNRIREDILKIEEMAQANIQRSNVMQEQLIEAKTAVLKALDHQDLVDKVVQVARQAQKQSRPSSTSSSRASKKKKS